MFKACAQPLDGLWANVWKLPALYPASVNFFTKLVGKISFEQVYPHQAGAVCTVPGVRFFTYRSGFSTFYTRPTNIKTNLNKGLLVI